MVAKLRVLSALCALVAAVIVVWQTNPAGPVRVDATDIPMTNVTTSIKWPVVETVDPDPFDPCRDIPLDVVQRIGLAYTPPMPEDSLRCKYDAGNYQVTVESFVWRTYEETLAAGRRRTRHRRSPRGSVLGDEADRLEQPVVDHLCGRRSTPVTASFSRCCSTHRSTPPTTSTACAPICSGRTNFRRTTSSSGRSCPSGSSVRACRSSPRHRLADGQGRAGDRGRPPAACVAFVR